MHPLTVILTIPALILLLAAGTQDTTGFRVLGFAGTTLVILALTCEALHRKAHR